MNFKYKNLAKKILEDALIKFYIKDKDIFQKNPKDNNDVFFKPIDISDNTIPNGNAMMLINFVRLGMMDQAERLSALWEKKRHPVPSYSHMIPEPHRFLPKLLQGRF